MNTSKRGRKAVGNKMMGVISVRCTTEQAKKMKKLGGSKWLRAQIDAAEVGGK